MKQAKIADASKCLFVDDKQANVNAAKRLGWGRCVHFLEPGLVEGTEAKVGDADAVGNDIPIISNLEELRVLWSDIFL